MEQKEKWDKSPDNTLITNEKNVSLGNVLDNEELEDAQDLRNRAAGFNITLTDEQLKKLLQPRGSYRRMPRYKCHSCEPPNCSYQEYCYNAYQVMTNTVLLNGIEGFNPFMTKSSLNVNFHSFLEKT